MAGAYSQPYQYDQYHQQYPVELIGKAIMYKQEKYDANRAKVQDFLNTFANMDLVKEEDKQHFANNISTLLQAVNTSGSGDLSKAGVTDQLIGNLSQAADDTVVNGFVGTQQFRAYQAKWDKIKQDKPEEYNEANYQYGLQNFNSWVNDGKAGTKLSSHKNDWNGAGIGQVTPYVDVIGELQKEVTKIKPDVKVIQTRTGWQFVNSKHEVVSDDDIKSLVDLKMQDSKFANQARINTWVTYGQANDEVLKKVSTQYLLEKKDNLARQILSLKDQALTAKDRTAINENIRYHQDLISQIDGKLADIPNNFGKLKVGLSSEIYQSELKKQMVGIYAKDNIVDIDYATDEQRKAIGEHALREDELRLKAELDATVNKKSDADKLAIEALKMQAAGNITGANDLNTAYKLLTGTSTSVLDATRATNTQMNLADIQVVAAPNKVTQLSNDVASLNTKMKDTGIVSVSQAQELLMDATTTPATKKSAEEYIRLNKLYTVLGGELINLSNTFTKQKISDVVRGGQALTIGKDEELLWTQQTGFYINKTIHNQGEKGAPPIVIKTPLNAIEAGKLIKERVSTKDNPEYSDFVNKNSRIVSKLYEGHQVELSDATGLNYFDQLKKKGAVIPEGISTENVTKYTESLAEKKLRPVIETNADGSVVLKFLNLDGTPSSEKPQSFNYATLPTELKQLSQASLGAQVNKETNLEIQFNFENPAVQKTGTYSEKFPQTIISTDGKSVVAEYIYKKDGVTARIELFDKDGRKLEVIPVPQVDAPTPDSRYSAVQKLNEIVKQKIAERI